MVATLNPTCVCVCAHVCEHVCMCVCVYVYVFVRMCVCVATGTCFAAGPREFIPLFNQCLGVLDVLGQADGLVILPRQGSHCQQPPHHLLHEVATNQRCHADRFSDTPGLEDVARGHWELQAFVRGLGTGPLVVKVERW
jgi:hypothetical protein